MLPDITASGRNIHVVWSDDTPGNLEIYYRRSTTNGSTWDMKRRLTKNAGDAYGPSIAVSGSNIYVVWMDNTRGNYEIYYKHSTDNGVTWGKTKRLTKNAGLSGFPSISVSGVNIHVVWSDDTPGHHEIYYKRSTNNGVSWEKTKRLTRNAGVSYVPSIAVSGGNIHVVWSDETPGNYDIYYRCSTDNGTTWSKQKHLTKNAGDSDVPAMALFGNSVHVVWSDSTPVNQEIYYKRSTNNGVSWEKTKRLTRNAGNSFVPAMAVSGSKIHIVWFDDTPGNGEIYYKRSKDNGATWGVKKRLSYNAGESFVPSIAVSWRNIHVVWGDDTSGNWEIYYRQSTDSGTTWGKEKHLTDNAGFSSSQAITASSSNIQVEYGRTTILVAMRSSTSGAATTEPPG
jgi:hypothetical protein